MKFVTPVAGLIFETKNRAIFLSGTHRQITAGFVMAREAGITSFTK